MSNDLWRKRRVRRWILTHPRLPLRISWALRRYTITPEQDAQIRAELHVMLTDILAETETL